MCVFGLIDIYVIVNYFVNLQPLFHFFFFFFNLFPTLVFFVFFFFYFYFDNNVLYCKCINEIICFPY